MSTSDEAHVSLVDQVQRLERRLARQVSAREQAEALLETKSLQLHELNRTLSLLNASLEQRVQERTQELDVERRHALFLAERDFLTGLPNRLLFRKHLARVLDHADHPNSVALICVDLDGFKGVNDTLGHASGDELLKAVGLTLSGLIDDTMLVARLGGDEFAIVLSAGNQPEQAMALAGRLTAALDGPFQLGTRTVQIGASAGIAMNTDAAESADVLLHNADLALYRAKARQRGTSELFSPEMDVERLSRLELERDLRRGLADRQFELFYQPLLEARAGGLVGFEALLRWHHPKRGLVPPAEFIPIAEENGLIHEIGAWVLKRACDDAAGWPSEIRVAVNLSPAQFTRSTLFDTVHDALDRSGLSADRLELEITESVLMQDVEATIQTLHRFRSLGIRVSMDDFGTGYSSLSYLNRFPFDKIKIDRSFVQAMSRDESGIAIIRAVIGLGRALCITISAEGVETQEQWEILRLEGCDELQGYLFGRPRAISEFNHLMADMLRQSGSARSTHGEREILPRQRRSGMSRLGA